MKLTNKTAIITGASTGIGRETAITFAKEGATVLLVARSIQGLQETKQFIEKENGNAYIFPANLSSADGINKLLEEIKKEYKQIDIIANIAGIWHGKDEVFAGKDFETFSQKIILDTFFVGTIAPTLLVHGLLPLMKNKSKILNLSGTFENGGKGWIPYYVSKRAIEDLTIGLAQELKEKDIQVNAISPSDTATDAYKKYFPEYIEDSIDPKKIAEFALKLVENDTITGKVFVMKKDQEPVEGFHH
jgi:NAD(P)-dependent dehydrogenase (short-subunit alcohol dehydrogenase family)